VFRLSEKYLACIKKHDYWHHKIRGNDAKYVLKTFKYIQPIRLKCGDYYVIKLIRIPTFLLFVVWATAKGQIFFKGVYKNNVT